MSIIDEIKYSKDDPEEYGVNLNIKKTDKENSRISDQERSDLISRSVKISAELFPEIFTSIDNAIQRLKINSENINFYIAPDAVANAQCRVNPFSSYVDIIISSRLIELLNKDELSFVIGHELAHYLYKHYLYPNPNFAFSELDFINLLHLNKSAEISADRLGLIGCNDVETTLRAMLKTAAGLPSKYINFNFEVYLRQLKDLKDFKNNASQLYSTHPSFLNRVQSIIWFSKTDIYVNNFYSNENSIYNKDEVDEMINKSIIEVVGKEGHEKNTEIYQNLKLWSSLDLFLCDGTFSKKEQEMFKEEFDEENLDNARSFLKLGSAELEKKIAEHTLQAIALTKSDKEKLMKELSIIAGKIGSEEKILLQKLSKLSNKLGLNKAISLIKS